MPEIRKGAAAVFGHRPRVVVHHPRGGGAHFLSTRKGGATLYNGCNLAMS
jgi:hypothetical protein